MIDADCRLILPEPPPSPQTQQAGAQEHDASGQGHGSKINLLHPEVQIFTITIISPDAEKRVEFTLFFRYSRAVGQHKPGNDDNRSKNHFAQLHACSLLLQRCLHLPLFPSGTHNTFS